MGTRPAVTVMLPAHNSESTLDAAIQSTLSQTFTDYELWILENGSTDRTLEVAHRYTDPRIRIFSLGPIGMQNALQYCLENARSPWMARLDADDLQHPHRLELQMEVATRNPHYVMVSSTCNWLTPYNHIFQRVFPVESHEFTLRTMLDGRYRPDTGKGRISGDPMTLFSRQIALDVGGYDDEFTMGDVPLWLRMLDGRVGWEQVDPLYLYRLSPTSASQSPGSAHEAWHARRKYDPEPKPAPARTSSTEASQDGQVAFWIRVARLELLAGNRDAAREIAMKLARDGYGRYTYRILALAALGPVGNRIFQHREKRRDPFVYRHRPDWENLFLPMLASREQPPAPGIPTVLEEAKATVERRAEGCGAIK